MAVTAKAFGEMKRLLSDDIVKGFKHLENSKLGFKTDKKQGYPIDVVRSCLIEAHLNGVKITGNEFNIIAEQMYITKEGFTGKMQRDRRFSEVRLNIGVPRTDQANKRSIVACSATWKYNGTDDEIQCEIPVIWNSYLSDDAVIGKAERKLRARIWNQATGDILSDGDADGAINEVVLAQAKPVEEIRHNNKAEALADKLGPESDNLWENDPEAAQG
jgi:hypothetical protein